MKHTSFYLFVLLMVFGLNLSASAQEEGGEKGEKFTAKMIEELSLTDEQAEKVKEINQETLQLLKDVRAKEYPTKKEKMEAAKAVRKSQDEKLKAVLDDTQWEKYKEMRKEARAKMKQRRGKRN